MAKGSGSISLVDMDYRTVIAFGGVLFMGYLVMRHESKELKDAVVKTAEKVAGKVGESIVETTQKVNPSSDKNVVYTGVNNVVGGITGDKNDTLGGIIYDWLNPNELKQIESTRIKR